MSKANQIIIEKEVTDDLVREIVKMERENFDEVYHIDHEEMREALEEPSAVTIIAYDENGNIGGYVLSIDFSEEYEDLKNGEDPDIENIEGALYMHSIVVRNDLRGKGYFGKLIKKLREAFPEKPIGLHASTANASSAGMQKYGARFVRRIDNWYGNGEPFDYLIFDPIEKNT